jgi:hypothetical protein
MQELNAAIKRINPSKSGGPDKIHPRFMTNLGIVAKDFLLRLFNKAWMLVSPWSERERALFQAYVAFEKSLRLETGNLRREVASAPECRRTKKTDWRDHTREIWKRSFPGVETPTQFPEAVAPWSEFAECTFKHTDVSKNQQEAVKKSRRSRYQRRRRSVLRRDLLHGRFC